MKESSINFHGVSQGGREGTREREEGREGGTDGRTDGRGERGMDSNYGVGSYGIE